MGEDQGHSVPADRPFVNEVDAQVPDLRSELVEAVQPALLGAPVESVRPVRDQTLEVRKIGALLPRPARRLIRPTRPSQPGLEVREDVIGNPDRERLDVEGGCALVQLDPPSASNQVALTRLFPDRVGSAGWSARRPKPGAGWRRASCSLKSSARRNQTQGRSRSEWSAPGAGSRRRARCLGPRA